MFAALVDERCDLVALEIIKASAGQWKAIRGQIFHWRRKIELPVKPGFYSVLIGGRHIHQVACFERADVFGENFAGELLYGLLVARGALQAGNIVQARDYAESQHGKRAGPAE